MVLSPVKINLGLEIFHRRPPDGYHCLASIFIPISFGDEIEIQDAPADRFTSENLLPPDRQNDFEAVSERGDLARNLVWRALRARDPAARPGIAVHLRKRVPAGSGLGGGSSNAGQVFRFMAAREGSAPQSFSNLARAIGSDVPFFLYDGPMLVTGTGDCLVRIRVGPGLGVLCLPAVAINTAAAYQDLKRTLQETPPPKSMSSLSGAVHRALERSDWVQVRNLKNDFEEPVFARHPELAAIKAAMYRAGAAYASLSGSGSALFALVSSREEQTVLQREMERTFPGLPFHLFEFRTDPSDV